MSKKCKERPRAKYLERYMSCSQKKTSSSKVITMPKGNSKAGLNPPIDFVPPKKREAAYGGNHNPEGS
jgi:hypothetical protein